MIISGVNMIQDYNFYNRNRLRSVGTYWRKIVTTEAQGLMKIKNINNVEFLLVRELLLSRTSKLEFPRDKHITSKHVTLYRLFHHYICNY